MLPSDVIKIKFYRPPNLKYLSGKTTKLFFSIVFYNDDDSIFWAAIIP